MIATSDRRRIGWMGWTLITLAFVTAALFGAWRYAMATNAVALLDWSDRTLGGTKGTAVAATGVSYGSHPDQQLEVIVPNTPGPHPVLVFIHGGGWNSGIPGDYHFIGRTFARAGYVVVLPGYRLGQAGRYPAMLEDSAAAVRWTLDNAARHGGDPDRVFLMGHSAGAYNAVMLGLERQWLGRQGVPDGFVKGVIGLSGPYDFAPFTTDSARAAFGHVPDPAQTQPVHYARADAPPMLLLTGDTDVTVKPRNSIALAKALTAVGTPTQAVVLKDVDHSGTVMKLARPFRRDARVLDAVLAFLAAHGAPSAPVQANAS
ncbi:alpha/beta hydrolase [Novosphingobium sp.]|uniref:alpha/beta hydrolase n=1 Tax=Novosphingobium sp. TaxID=1874826 RepID=UPI002735556A|nr:alpha/beta hydrolase [Novosphingobium sp.]MDP3907579.1 alpha/beta hydrolase [Novosphingobium sp.]